MALSYYFSFQRQENLVTPFASAKTLAMIDMLRHIDGEDQALAHLTAAVQKDAAPDAVHANMLATLKERATPEALDRLRKANPALHLTAKNYLVEPEVPAIGQDKP